MRAPLRHGTDPPKIEDMSSMVSVGKYARSDGARRTVAAPDGVPPIVYRKLQVAA
jgi:hypothetical protein